MLDYEAGIEMIGKLREGELTERFIDSLRADDDVREVERYILLDRFECRALGIKPYSNPPQHEALVAAWGVLGR